MMSSASTRTSLYTVPVASTSFIEEAYWDGATSSIRFTYESDSIPEDLRSVSIRFVRPMLLIRRAESFSSVEHIEGCYDTLVEVEDSPWIKAQQHSIARADMTEAHHYMIYLDSAGSFELIAQSFSIQETPVSRRQPRGIA